MKKATENQGNPGPSFSSVSHSPSTESVKNFSNHSTPSHSRSDQETELKVTPSNSRSKNDEAQKQEHFTYEQISSSENLVPAVGLNCTSQKRRREFEDCYENIKKPCSQDANSSRPQTTKPTPFISLNTSLVSQPTLKNSSVLELQPKTTDGHLQSELACGQSTSSEPTQSHNTLPPKHYPPLMGAKQVYITTTENLVKLSLSPRPSEESVKKGNEENHQNDKSSASLKDNNNSPCADSASRFCHTGPVLPVKTPRVHQVGEKNKNGSTPKLISKLSLSSQSGRKAERTKTSRVRRPVVPDDIDLLFTPDPLVYVVSATSKTAKPKTHETVNSQTIENVTRPVTRSVSSVSASSCHMTPHSKVAERTHAVSSSEHHSPLYLPTVTLTRVKQEKLHISENKGLKNIPSPTSGRQLKDETVQSHHKQSPLRSTEIRSSSVESDTAASEQKLPPHCTPALPLEEKTGQGSKTEVNEEDPIDVELDLGLSIAYEVDLTQSSDSSEEEQLVSFKEMMERVTKPPETPEKGAFSEPSTPGLHSSQSKNQQLLSTTKSSVYKNNLDQMLKEINSSKRAKEIEAQLLTACEEDLLELAEYEGAEEDQTISSEQQEFLERYSLMSSAIREVPPGESVFNLTKCGRIFDQDTLQLRQCMVNPQGAAQKTLLWSSSAQLELHINIGLVQTAYCHNSPCPSQVTRFLFKMMSVHNKRMVSEKILQALCDIACSTAYQIVNNGNQQFEVWVPSLADMTLVLMNMGIAFVTLFPFEDLQPSFTEGDLLENVYIKCESPSNNQEEMKFPEHNCCNILKYLSYCMDLCPRVYSDYELLLLLTVVGRISLETRWILQSRVDVRCLQFKIVKNIRDWHAMLPRICQALTNLTNDHHNMCLLVQLLPDDTRGRRLRRHLSICFISKLLDGTCTYIPSEEEFQLAELRPYLPRMKPSALQGLHQGHKASLDQQAYYLCYSLLLLTNEASNLQVFPPSQKAHLIALSYELEMHVKCDIRESEKCLYRSKVKDLVARISTKWQMLLQRTRPLNSKLYDYWQPLDMFRSSQEDEEVTLIEEEDDEEEDTTLTNENDVLVVAENEEEKEDVVVETEDDIEPTEKAEDIEADGAKDDTSRTEEATVQETVNQMIPVMHSQALDDLINAYRHLE